MSARTPAGAAGERRPQEARRGAREAGPPGARFTIPQAQTGNSSHLNRVTSLFSTKLITNKLS